MGCNHKFEKYLYLNDLQFEPTTLIIGTFNPACVENNEAEWFYGRTNFNYFWDVLPRLYNEDSLIGKDPSAWKRFCKKHRIAITDFIASIDDADINNKVHKKALEGYSDKGITKTFKQFSFVDIVAILKAHPTIKNVYLTRSANERFWKNLWNPIKEYCIANGIRAEFLLTPSGNARYQRKDKSIPLQDFIYPRWLEVFKAEETSGDHLEINYKPEWFQSGYYVYILTIKHKTRGKYFYIGQTGDRNHSAARSPFYRLMGHFNTYNFKNKGTDAQLIKGLVNYLLITTNNGKSVRQNVEDSLANGLISITANYFKIADFTGDSHNKNRMRTEEIEISLLKMFNNANLNLFNDPEKIGDKKKIESLKEFHPEAIKIFKAYEKV